MEYNFYLIFLLLLLLNFFFLKKFNFLTKIINIFDVPDSFRKKHKKSTPVVGGFIIYINLILILLIDFFFTKYILDDLFNEFEFLSFFLVFSLFFILGLYDDKYFLTASVKLFISLVLLIVFLYLNSELVLRNIYLVSFDASIILAKYSIIVTVVSIMLFQNSINMFDGSDLQFANFSLICILFLLFKSDYNFFFLLISIPFIFYWYLNKNKYSFLGDGGAISLAFFFSIFFIKFYNVGLVVNSEDIVVLMLVPGIDMFRLFMLRIINKTNPFSADENHIHHILYRLFKDNFKVQLVIFLVSIISILIYYLFNNMIYSVFLLFLFFMYFIKQDKFNDS